MTVPVIGPVTGQGTQRPTPATLTIPAPVLEQLESHGLAVAHILDEVERRLHTNVASSHAFADQAARYLIAAGGKRFRPLVVALTAHLGDASRDEIPDVGVVVELVHLATLYHDDVIDEADARRGIPAANLRWGNTVAILTGDYLFARASELSADLGVEVTRAMAQTIATLCEGEIREVQASKGVLPPDVPRLEPSLEHYLQVVSEKTASLIATSCRLGAMLAGCPVDVVEQVTTYGWSLGMAFQLSDDVLDIASAHEDSGKTPGTDLRLGIRTLPMIHAVAADPDGELAGLLARDRLSDAQVGRALDLLRVSPGMDRARDDAADHAARAVDHLTPLTDTAATKALRHLANYAVARVA